MYKIIIILLFALIGCRESEQPVVTQPVKDSIVTPVPVVDTHEDIRQSVIGYIETLGALNREGSGDMKTELKSYYADRMDKYFRRDDVDKDFVEERIDSDMVQCDFVIKDITITPLINDAHLAVFPFISNCTGKDKMFYFAIKFDSNLKIYYIRNFNGRRTDDPNQAEEDRVKYIIGQCTEGESIQ